MKRPIGIYEWCALTQEMLSVEHGLREWVEQQVKGALEEVLDQIYLNPGLDYDQVIERGEKLLERTLPEEIEWLKLCADYANGERPDGAASILSAMPESLREKLLEESDE